MNYIFTTLLVTTFFLTSCHYRAKKEIETGLKYWKNKEIIFTNNLEIKINGKDTVTDLLTKEYKIVNYIDTSGCTECRLELYEWMKKIKESEMSNLNVGFLFIAHLKTYEQLEILQKTNLFDYPFFYDKSGKMDEVNNFSQMPIFQTFLIDKNNRVLLAGSPIRNEKLWNLYKDIIRSHKTYSDFTKNE